MYTMLRFLVLSLLAVSLCAKPNFTGEWKMDPARSDFSGMPAPDKMIRTVKHDEPAIQVKTVQSGAQGEVTTELKYTTDGKEFTGSTRFGEVKGTAKWDGDVLVVDTRRNVQGTEITGTDRWTLSPDGKTITIDARIRSPQGEMIFKVTFEKQ